MDIMVPFYIFNKDFILITTNSSGHKNLNVYENIVCSLGDQV
jgi:hypothetical protein